MTADTTTRAVRRLRLRLRPRLAMGLALGLALAGCVPRIALEAPKEPITINLNVKIDHEIRLRVEKDIDKLLSNDSGLF